ncbi:MAG: hypothetical protein WBB07_06050 [Mycobacterium sp.]
MRDWIASREPTIGIDTLYLNCRNPWRSVDGYAGFSSGVQLPALISVALPAASVAGFTNHSAHEDRGGA